MVELTSAHLVDLLLSAFGALTMWLLTVLVGRFSRLEKSIDAQNVRMDKNIDNLRTELIASATKTEAEFRILSDKSSEWREHAVSRFATREELHDVAGKRIADAIILAANKLLQRDHPLRPGE